MKSVVAFLYRETKNLIVTIRASIMESYRKAPPEMQKAAKRILAGALIVVVLVVLWKVGFNLYEARELRAEQEKGPQVKVAKATNAATERTTKIVGEASPFANVTLYAKVSGYLKDIKVDKGDVVKTGQVLAIIESPETDRAYDAARADARNKQAISDRMQKLLERTLVSQQEADQAKSDAEVAKAHYESAAILKAYETLRAPFDGTIVQRFADPGALVQNATNSQTSALPVVAIQQVKQLRVYVYLDQRDAPYVQKGQTAEISLPDNPDMKLEGHVEHISGGLDQKTRMLLTEVSLDNKEGKIVAGSLVQVALHLNAAPGIEIPSEALVLRDGKTMVPLVDENSEVIYTEVKVIESSGDKIKVSSGLKEGQTVALNLGNTRKDHDKVRPIADASAPQGAVVKK